MPKLAPHPATHHRILWLTVVGGFLDGAKLEFSSGLNCITGGRGTGKTTILELLRFALDELPEEPSAQKRVRELVKCNLKSGRVELGIETKDGLKYIVSRAVDETPIVLNEARASRPR